MFNFNCPETNSNNFWVKCPSRKFGGMFYYYNTRTKLSVWNLNDLTVTNDVNYQQISNVPFINREPLNPPNVFRNVPQSCGNQSINTPFNINASTNTIPLLYPNRIVSKPNVWDSNQSRINSKQFISVGTQTSDIDEKDLNVQCAATPLRNIIKKEVNTDRADSNGIFEHGYKAIIYLTNNSSHSSSNTKNSRTSTSTTDVENNANDDIINIDLLDLNINNPISSGTCTKDENDLSSNILAVTDLRHIITGKRQSKTCHDLGRFANDKGPYKNKICNTNDASKESTNESVEQNKSSDWNLAQAAPDQMTSPWCLVVDTNMLLLELDFIINLLKSNPDCKLRVPDIVQKQLRNLSVNKLVESSLTIAARSAIRYLINNLSEDSKIKINSQVSERKDIEESDVIDNMINCCMQIKNTNHFLIVLSNNEILNKKLKLLGIDCYSNNKLNEVMENIPKTMTLHNTKNTARKRAFDSITMSNIDSKRMCTEILPKNTSGTSINNKNNFKDFLSGNDQSIPTSTFSNDKPIESNCMKIIGSARKKVIENQSKKETMPAFALTFKSLAEKYYSASLQQNPSMFKITNKVIENKLKLRMDEWLCQFIQVMEETLIQVLQGFSSMFTCPPSLTLQEAVELIHKVHKNNETIKEYCNNFSSLLSVLNDANGKFNKDLSPNKFMKIFASGYQLVELLLDLEQNDVGLKSGIKYMKELLDEINNPVDVDIHDFDSDNDPTSYLEDVPNIKNKPASSSNKVSTSTENIVVQVTNEGKQKTVSLTPIPKENVNNNTENNCNTIRSGTKNDNLEENSNKHPSQHAACINKESELPAVEKGEATLDANVQVAFVFQKFFVEIETTFVLIENFIKETKKHINTMDDNKKKQSGHKLSQIYVILLNIIKSLKQIMFRDRFEDENIRYLIAKVIPTQEINNDIIMDYSEKVVKYLDQAALLENALNELLTCLKTGAIKIVKTTLK